MKAFHHLLTGLILAGLTGAAYAQASNSDLIVGFNAQGGTGASTNVMVDIGSVGDYYNAYSSGTGGTYTVGNLNTSLTNTYGSGWNTRSDLWFGVAGATTGLSSSGPNGQRTDTIWVSSAGNGSTNAPAWKQKFASFYITPNANISAIYNAFTTLTSGATSLSDINSQGSQFGTQLQGISISTSAGQAWSAAPGGGASLASPSAFALVTFANTGVQFETLANGAMVLDLYQSQPGTGNGTDLGYFALAGNGDLSFTAIPEPSAYAAILGVAALGFVTVRRRQKACVA
jgi:hypothetical protein